MKYSKGYSEVLKKLTEKYAPDICKQMVMGLIDTKKFEIASICVMGAIDGQWEKKLISDETATEALALLELDPELRAGIRTISLSGRYD